MVIVTVSGLHNVSISTVKSANGLGCTTIIPITVSVQVSIVEAINSTVYTLSMLPVTS